MQKKSKWKIVLIIIAVLFGIGIIGNLFGEDDAQKASPTAPSSTPTEKVTATPDKEDEVTVTLVPTVSPTKALADPTKGPKQTIYDAGTYKVGSDIPSGEYVLFCDNFLLGYMEVASDSSGSLDSIIANENFDYNTIITLNDGEYFKTKGAYAIPIDEAGDLDTSGSGMFKIGTHLPSGEYKLECTDTSLGFGYYEVSTDSTHILDSIVTNENFERNSYVTVKDGQYLKISSAKITK
jgi:hypothetical protein